MILWPTVIWLALNLATPRPPLPLTGAIDRIVIDKSDRMLVVYRDGRPLRAYNVALGFAPEGDKDRQGDGRTPEGLFTIDRRNAASRFRLSLGIDCPRPDDIARAAAGGYSPGGDIFIHGQRQAVSGWFAVQGDWTAGSVAVSNAQMVELWRIAPVGTPVESRP